MGSYEWRTAGRDRACAIERWGRTGSAWAGEMIRAEVGMKKILMLTAASLAVIAATLFLLMFFHVRSRTHDTHRPLVDFSASSGGTYAYAMANEIVPEVIHLRRGGEYGWECEGFDTTGAAATWTETIVFPAGSPASGPADLAGIPAHGRTVSSTGEGIRNEWRTGWQRTVALICQVKCFSLRNTRTVGADDPPGDYLHVVKIGAHTFTQVFRLSDDSKKGTP
jgi:hypothetical protein